MSSNTSPSFSNDVLNETQERIKALRQKQIEFERNKDFSRATHAKIVADFLEDFVEEQLVK
jgi:hypothetical protein